MSTNLGFVAHAAQRDAHELPSERLGNRARERCLADAGRAHEAEDRTLHVGIELPDREVLEDAIFDLLEPRVVGIEHLLGAMQVDDVIGPLAPWQSDEPVEIGA